MGYKVILNDAFKRFTLDQDKIKSPEETIKFFKEKLKTINLDIFQSAERIDNGRLDIPVFFSRLRKMLGCHWNKKTNGKRSHTPRQKRAP